MSLSQSTLLIFLTPIYFSGLATGGGGKRYLNFYKPKDKDQKSASRRSSLFAPETLFPWEDYMNNLSTLGFGKTPLASSTQHLTSLLTCRPWTFPSYYCAYITEIQLTNFIINTTSRHLSIEVNVCAPYLSLCVFIFIISLLPPLLPSC